MSTAVNTIGAPVFDGDLFTDDVLRNSGPVFKELRELGDVVWLSKLNMYAVPRYGDVMECLKASNTLICGKGVTCNEDLNRQSFPGASLLVTDKADGHDELKKTVIAPLTLKAIPELRPRLKSAAQRIVSELANSVEFEAMSALASYLPTHIVVDLIGIRGVTAELLLKWSTWEFDAFGPASPKTNELIAKIDDLMSQSIDLGRENFSEGGWADQLIKAGESGKMELETAQNLLIDYLVPSLDTTIYATGEMLYRLATVPAALKTLQASPELIPSFVTESVRMASPVRAFTRYVTEDFAVSESILPANSRVLILFGSANRDERHYTDPDTFDIGRDPRDQLAWGLGTHACLGKHLARAEMEVLLETIVAQVNSIDIGVPTRAVNNALQGYETLPLTLHTQ